MSVRKWPEVFSPLRLTEKSYVSSFGDARVVACFFRCRGCQSGRGRGAGEEWDSGAGAGEYEDPIRVRACRAEAGSAQGRFWKVQRQGGGGWQSSEVGKFGNRYRVAFYGVRHADDAFKESRFL